MIYLVLQRRCSVVLADANHDCITTSWRERRIVEPLDGILQDASKHCASANYVDGRRTRFVVHGNVAGGKFSVCIVY